MSKCTIKLVLLASVIGAAIAVLMRIGVPTMPRLRKGDESDDATDDAAATTHNSERAEAVVGRKRGSAKIDIGGESAAERWPRASWIILGSVFVAMGAFSAHASWRDYEGLITGFVILAVFSSVSVALSGDAIIAALRVPIKAHPLKLMGDDALRMLTDDNLRLLTFTAAGVLATAIYPMIPAVRHMVAFLAGGSLAAAVLSVLVLLARHSESLAAALAPRGD